MWVSALPRWLLLVIEVQEYSCSDYHRHASIEFFIAHVGSGKLELVLVDMLVVASF